MVTGDYKLIASRKSLEARIRAQKPSQFRQIDGRQTTIVTRKDYLLKEASKIKGIEIHVKLHSSPISKFRKEHPPAWMMTLVGFGDLTKHEGIQNLWQRSVDQAALRFSHQLSGSGFKLSEIDVYELGCGCGRLASELAGRTRSYTGSDTNKDFIKYNSKAYPNGTFKHLDFHNEMYNPNGKLGSIKLEEKPSSFDIFYGASVFTHFRSGHVAESIAEASSLLRPGGLLIQSIYLKRSATNGRDTVPRGGGLPISHELDAYSWSQDKESNVFVVYDEGFILESADQNGFDCYKIARGPWGGLKSNIDSDWQDWILLRKK